MQASKQIEKYKRTTWTLEESFCVAPAGNHTQTGSFTKTDNSTSTVDVV